MDKQQYTPHQQANIKNLFVQIFQEINMISITVSAKKSVNRTLRRL